MYKNKLANKDRETIEELYLDNFNPKIKQKLRIISMDKDFVSSVSYLRKKWKLQNKKFKELTNSLRKVVPSLRDKKTLPRESIDNQVYLEILRIARDIQNILKNNELKMDILMLADKFKLHPTSLWFFPLSYYVLSEKFENLFPPIGFLGQTLIKFSNDIWNKMSEDLNFEIIVRNNKLSKEPELFLHIFENTSLQDIKNHWSLINACQNELKKLLKINKRYYPLKNLEIFKKLGEIDKKKVPPYFEPTTDTWENYKLKDREKAEEIYGKGILKKNENKLKQIRYRYKKMTHS